MSQQDFRVGTGTGAKIPATTSLGVGSANFVQIAGATTGNRVTMTAAGTDTNVGINLVTKGTGTVTINGTAVPLAPAGTNGQIQYNNAGAYGGLSTTGSGNVVLASAPAIVGGTHTALTGFSLANAGSGAFNTTLLVNTTMTTNASLNIALGSAARVLSLSGDVTLAGGFTTSGFTSLTLTGAGATNVTLPASGTLATLAGTETLSNKTVQTVASTTGAAGLRLPHGTAPTAPVNGDMWTTTTNLKVQINSATKTVAFADSLSTTARYPLAATGGTASWIKLGVFNAGQSGRIANIRIYAHASYTASNTQDSIIDIFFKTSNGTNVDANGFAGNSWFTVNGPNAAVLSSVKWVSNLAGTAGTTFTLYANAATFTDNSFYEVLISDQCTWTDASATGQTDPGAASSTVCVASLSSTGGFSSRSIATVTASSTDAQGQAPLTADVNLVTTNVSTANACTMPAATVGRWVTVINPVGATMMLYPASGDHFFGTLANYSLAFTFATNGSGGIDFYCYTAGEWMLSIQVTGTVGGPTVQNLQVLSSLLVSGNEVVVQNPVDFYTGLQIDTTYTPPGGDQVQFVSQTPSTALFLPTQGVGTVAALQADNCILEMSKTINSNYTITTGQNALTAGPITIATGASVSVPVGSTWSIV